MRAFFVILIVLAAAVGVMAYSHMEVVDTILSRTREATTEPATLLVSGSALLLIAIALRRLA